MISRPLIDVVLARYALPLDGIHGPPHWARVLENGRRLAELTGADLEVVELFALFHDACRRHDGADPGHGERGAALASDLRGSLYDLDGPRTLLLLAACRLHTSGVAHEDVTVQTCWDADRLDLPRAGIFVDPRRLLTKAARRREMIGWAQGRALDPRTPGLLQAEWGLEVSAFGPHF